MDLTIELQALEIVKHKLAVSIKSMTKTVEAEKKRQKEKSDLLGLDDEESIIQAYGYDLITEDEYNKLMQKLEVETVNERALKTLQQLHREITRDARNLRYEMLPAEEKERIAASNDKWREDHKKMITENKDGDQQ